MPELTPTGAVDVVQRQVRRVRRRKNLYELQRTFYLAITATAVAAAILLPLALFAPADLFAVAAWSTVAVLAGLVLILIGAVRRRWLQRGRAVAWIESQSALAGRVRTLLELAARARATGGASGFFHALLVSQVRAGLDAWRPARLVPRSVPRAALATAVVALAVLVLVFQLASLALPTPPSGGFSDRPLAGERLTGAAGMQPGERGVVAPGVPGRTGDRPAAAAGAARNDDSTLTQLSSAVQENVRRQVWGKAWERVRDALARAGASSGANPGGTEQREELDAEGSDEWEVARAPSGDPTRDRGPGSDREPDEHGTDPNADTESEATAETPEAREHAGGAGSGGAGNSTSPGDLFSGASVDTDGTNASFELSLAARMRSDRAGQGKPDGPPPAADPDTKPTLASDQRRESAAHRMAVPAAYEQVVREVFAHREEP